MDFGEFYTFKLERELDPNYFVEIRASLCVGDCRFHFIPEFLFIKKIGV